MNRNTWILITLLLALNLIGTAHLVVSQLNIPNQNKFQKNLSESQLAQLDKIFHIAMEFRAELENVISRTSYPKERDKESANEYLQDYKIAFEVARIEYQNLLEDKTRTTALRFLLLCWGDKSNWSDAGVIEFRRYSLAEYDKSSGQYIPYPNANSTKLETLENEFRALAFSLLKDFK